MDGGIGIFIVFIIIGLISAVSSAAKKKSGSGQGEPPRRTLSDIQRAFMMMSGMDDDEQQAPRNVPPAAPRQTYTPPQSGYAPPPAYGEGASDYGYNSVQEGYTSEYSNSSEASGSREGYTSELTRRSGSIQGDTVIAKEAGYTQYTAVEERMIEAEESIDENELSILQESGGIYGEDLSAGANTKHTVKPALKLFSDKSDFVRAVIYSEILGSGPLGKRAAK